MSVQRKRIVFFLCIFGFLSCIIGYLLSKSTDKVFASSETPLYEVKFTETGWFGQEQGVNLSSGDTAEMEFTVVNSVGYSYGHYNVGFIVTTTKDNLHDNPYILDKSVFFYGNPAFDSERTGRCSPHLSSGLGDDELAEELGGNFDPSIYLMAGNSIKVVYKPYISESEKGSIEIFVKAEGDEIYSDTPTSYVKGLPASIAPNTDVRLIFHNARVGTLNITDYSIKAAGISVGKFATHKCMVSKVITETSYQANFDLSEESKNDGWFGNLHGIDIKPGEVFTLQYDILSSNIPAGANINLGFIMTPSEAVVLPYMAKNSFYFFCNDAYGEGNRKLFVINSEGDLEEVEKSTDELIMSSVFSGGRTVKFVYKPYESEDNKGYAELYVKDMEDAEDKFSLIAYVRGLNEAQAPNSRIRLLTYIGVPSWYKTNISLNFYKYSLFTQTTIAEGTGTSALCDLQIKEIEDKTVVKHFKLDASGSGYIANGMPFNKAKILSKENKTVTMEYSVLDRDFPTDGAWLGFAFGQSVRNDMYIGKGGYMAYLSGSTPFAIYETNKSGIAPTKESFVDQGYLLSKGYRFKVELDLEKKTLSVYEKHIGDKEYDNNAILVSSFDIPDFEIPDNFYFGINFQYALNVELGDIAYSAAGEKQEVQLLYNTANASEINDCSIDRALMLVANRKSPSETGSITYVYDNDLDLGSVVEFDWISGTGLKVLFSENKNNFEDAACIDVDLSWGHTDTYKISFSNGKIYVYGKCIADSYFYQLNQGVEREFNPSSKFYIAFRLENSESLAKRVVIDDLIISTAGISNKIDFNRGPTEDFTVIKEGYACFAVGLYDYSRIDYVGVDGTVFGTSYVANGNMATIPLDLNNPLEDYKNWYYIIEQSRDVYDNKQITVVKSTDKEYIVVSLDGGLFDDGSDNKFVVSGSTLTAIADVPKTGEKFDGWFIKGETKAISTDSSYTFVVDKSVNLQAKFSILQVSVKIENGKMQGDATEWTGNYGTSLTIKADDAPPYKVFQKWIKKDTTTEVSTNPKFYFEATEDVVLTAIYEDVTFLITLVNATCNGQTTVKATIGESLTIVANEPVKGKVFTGWIKNNSIAFSEQSTFTYTVEPSDIILTARFKDVLYSVKAENGAVNVDTAKYGETVIFIAEEKEGKTFVGWYNGTEKVSDELYLELEIESDISLTAKYEEGKSGGCNSAITMQSFLISLSLLAAGIVFLTIRRKMYREK